MVEWVLNNCSILYYRAYYNIGFALIAHEQKLKLRFRKFNVPLALAAALLMCGDHESLLYNASPR